jgi:hypothetical protein
MATQEDVLAIVAALPGTTWQPDGTRYLIADKAYAWVWLERVDPKRRRVPNPDVLVVWVGSEHEKHALIALDPHVFFTDPHYDGYPAVLVRLRSIERGLLEKLLTDAWRLRCAPPRRREPQTSRRDEGGTW